MEYIVKICGLTRAEDAALCARAGADWLGFIFHPQSPRCIAPELAADFDTGQAKRVGVFVHQSLDETLRIMEAANLDLAQLHGGQDAAFCRAVGPERVVKTLWPQSYEKAGDLEREEGRLAGAVSYFLLDAGKSGGGHGRALDPAPLGGQPPRPRLLAGGLTAGLVADLMNSGRPALAGLAGFDFNSGVEKSPGRKDVFLVEAAIRAVRDNTIYGRFNA